jgi:hypothetical protein
MLDGARQSLNAQELNATKRAQNASPQGLDFSVGAAIRPLRLGESRAK